MKLKFLVMLLCLFLFSSCGGEENITSPVTDQDYSDITQEDSENDSTQNIGKATLSWESPNTNDDEDESCLTDLSYFTLYYNTQTVKDKNVPFVIVFKNDDTCIDTGILHPSGCGNLERCNITISNLDITTWHFVVTASNTAHNESGFSNQVSKEIY